MWPYLIVNGKTFKTRTKFEHYNHPKNEKSDREDENQSDAIEFTIMIIYCGFPETEAR